MISVFGTYKNGKVLIDEQIDIDEEVKVIVTFLQPEPKQEKQLKWENFNFDKVKKLTKHIAGNLSDTIIEERRGILQ